MDKLYTHQLIDSLTGCCVGKYTSLSRALRAADRKDMQHGAVRYIVQPITIVLGYQRA